ncbi:MAG: DUF1292 domain-containing protein [Firmicutes bacterium]|nr:DUF1292 domain-containing protein [Bacillota bacterium]
MSDDSNVIQLYNEEENQLLNFIEYRRLQVRGRNYALLQPEEDQQTLIPFRVEQVVSDEGNAEEEMYVYVIDDDELAAVEAAWQKLHS